ncbi:MAG TPA: response regulator [Janthinobacterium sp.]|nr:response regulator [Janthinobacterium sp.]
MFSFGHSSIRRQLTLISVLSSGSALFLILAVVATTSLISHRENEERQLSALAQAIGADSVPALLLADRARAEQILTALNINDDIGQAILFNRDGKPFARYSTAEDGFPPASSLLSLKPRAEAPSHIETGGSLWAPVMRLHHPVWHRREWLGTLVIEADLTRMWLDILKNLAVIAATAVLSLGVALLLAARLRDLIAGPIAKLIEAARLVSDSQNYGHRIVHRRSDELGTLIDSFNDMLAQIASRDASLADYRDQLERQVGARTEQLEKAKNAAEAASQAKSAFLATMSHEIRTPMNGVLGMTELLLASNLSEQQRHYTSMVQRSGQHLLVIINDILDFSKIEAGKLTVEYIHFNFRELLDDIDTIFSPQAQAKGISLELAIANDIPIAICGDPNRLRQVIVNLLGNAIKFTESGNITVKVKVTGEDSQAVSLRFEVHDTGIGVSSDAQARIFDSFSQADGSTTRKHGGTGLGLAISKQLVELMGGKIGVDNALTQGSIFWFTVNFDKRRVEADDPSLIQKTTQGLRALIVDDNPGTRKVLERQLASWYIYSDSVASATAGLKKLQEAVQRDQPYDVALLDMQLPRTSGLALAATIKADPSISDVKLLLLSTERDAADSLQRREAGVAFQLIKPARECDLFDCIVNAGRARGVKDRNADSRARTAAAIAAPAGRGGDTRRASPAARKRRKVLLAEDNPVNIEVAMAMLAGLGLAVVSARNGEEALHAVQTEDFDLVLMDCQMPLMDGFAATAEIRRHEQQRGRARILPIIAITANALQGDREACLAAGMDDYLSKPFTQQELGLSIARWIPLPRAATVHHDEAAMPAPEKPLRTAGAALCPTATAASASATPAAAAAAKTAINRHALENIRALSASDGDALLQRVIHAYVDDTPQHLQALRMAIAALDTEHIRKAAHSLKSSSANIGAEALAQLCKAMETLGRSASTDGAAGILTDMEQEFLAVRHSLSAILEKET